MSLRLILDCRFDEMPFALEYAQKMIREYPDNRMMAFAKGDRGFWIKRTKTGYSVTGEDRFRGEKNLETAISSNHIEK